MATQTSKAKRIDVRATPRARSLTGSTDERKRPRTPPAPAADSAKRSSPGVARAEVIDKATRARFEEELDGALKRKPTSETKLGGALRAVAVLSPALRQSLVDAAQVMVRRGSYARDLYSACIRTLAESEDKSVGGLLKAALAADDAGGNATLSAACFSKDALLTASLAKLAASRQSHLAFGAETARVCRRESNGAHLTAIAPMIKESHRIALCVDLFVPLARSAPIPVHVAPALAVLRGAERHLGRWLVLADVAAKSGDEGPLQEATQKSQVGPTSARAAWSLVAWALSETKASVTPNAPAVMSPATRPTVELVARLSDRPSADRDTTFLFRMARARAASCKPMLEGLVKSPPLMDEVAIRAASYLARDHGRDDMKEALVDCALNAKREELRGLAVAALWDVGDSGARDRARDLSDELVVSRCISSVAWGALVRAAHARVASPHADDPNFVVVAETPFRWIQWGWLE
jgi:hypothetical protein